MKALISLNKNGKKKNISLCNRLRVVSQLKKEREQIIKSNVKESGGQKDQRVCIIKSTTLKTWTSSNWSAVGGNNVEKEKRRSFGDKIELSWPHSTGQMWTGSGQYCPNLFLFAGNQPTTNVTKKWNFKSPFNHDWKWFNHN